ncbi:hypothetical protein TNCV_1246261 [Trichonephila clavipes]|uniref:Uncharacterized protein n=1 Tax=Trichonephila clavipes TaxID=2585209 RepID=A0A8X6RA19_TRICX|nr:hypothetical protein TNCV_1246261 [Trichonephila clavipes]
MKFPYNQQRSLSDAEIPVTFVFGPFVFEEFSEHWPSTCSVTVRRYHDLLQTFVVPQLQQRWILTSTIFVHDGVATLNDLKNFITLHVQSLTTDQLRSAVEYTVHRFEVLRMNEGGDLEHLSLHRPGHD